MKKVLIVVFVVLLLASPAFAQGENEAKISNELYHVRMVMPADFERLDDGPYWVAKAMGYFEQEGIDFEMLSAYGTTDIKMVATGNAEFCGPGPSYVLSAVTEGLPVMVVSGYDEVNIWGMCVLNSSVIKSFEDMKDAKKKYGRKLTCALGDASWEALVTPSLVAAGVDPVEDIEWVVAGENRYIQVSEGKLDMLFTWLTEGNQLIGQGFDFNYLDCDPYLKTCSNSHVTSEKMMKEHPEIVRGFIRAVAKGAYFIYCNPEAAAAIVLQRFPNIDIPWDAAVGVQKGRVRQVFGDNDANLLDKICWSWEERWETNEQAAIESGVISKYIPLENVYTNEFVDLDWDRAAVEKDAANYDYSATKAKYSK